MAARGSVRRQYARISDEMALGRWNQRREACNEGERFEVYDASGKMVGTYRGNRIGEGLLPAVYFIKPCDAHGGSLRVVKAR